MQFKVGDKVSIVDEKAEGIITQINSEEEIMVEIEGFEFPYPASKLIPATEQIEIKEEFIDPKIAHIVKQQKEQERPKKRSKSNKRTDYREVDLHIYELVDDYKNLTNGEIVQIQVDHFLKHLEKAINNREPKVVFIHGVGEGVLKHEIRDILKRYEAIEFYDAPYRLYGHGATEVLIRHSKIH